MDTFPERMAHLKQLEEAESIHIMREVASEFDHPVTLYSVGKESSIILHVANKVFAFGIPPFPLMRVDTTCVKGMIEFRDKTAKKLGMELIVHQNPKVLAMNTSPFVHSSSKYTDIMANQSLKQTLDKHGFDVVFGGARCDEKKSRAKERVYSFRYCMLIFIKIIWGSFRV